MLLFLHYLDSVFVESFDARIVDTKTQMYNVSRTSKYISYSYWGAVGPQLLASCSEQGVGSLGCTLIVEAGLLLVLCVARRRNLGDS